MREREREKERGREAARAVERERERDIVPGGYHFINGVFFSKVIKLKFRTIFEHLCQTHTDLQESVDN